MEQRDEATRQRGFADEQRKIADEQRDEAVAQKKVAEEQRAEAARQRDEAQRQRDAALGALLRSVAREEIAPRFRSLGEQEIFSKASAADPDDVVTEADLAIERRLTLELRALLPGSRLIGEEAAAGVSEPFGPPRDLSR